MNTIKPDPRNSFPKRPMASPWGALPLWLDVCEDRLVLSALPMFDLSHHLWDEATQVPQEPAGVDLAPQPSLSLNDGLQPLAAASHAVTGWNDVQRLYGLRGGEQTVAVIDSGIAWDHVALGKGFGQGYRVVGGWDFAENDALPYDDAPAGYHGTHVSGIIGARDATRSGVAPDVDLVSLRVFDDAGKGQMAWTEEALRWVHQHRNAFASPITTVNLSLGSTWNSATVPSWGVLEDELLQLQQDGIVVVASAGNSFKQYQAPGLSYPAASPYVIPVASVDANGLLSDFSQRHERVLAAPGRQISSTIPDHVLGADGMVDDWSTASGTSMAAPYVSGAAVLVREAMELVGRTSIRPQEIYQWMVDTADSVWDSATQATYDRLNLSRAIQSLFPTDTVGDAWSSAQELNLQNRVSTDGWFNTLGDRDVYRFTAAADGVLSVDAAANGLEQLRWTMWVNGQETPIDASGPNGLNVQAGQTYALGVSHHERVGSYRLEWDFSPRSNADNSNGSLPNASPPVELGDIDYRELAAKAGQAYTLQATHEGTLSILVEQPGATGGILELRDASGGTVLRDTTLEDGKWRIDVEATAGSRWLVQMPSTLGEQAELSIANLIQRQGSSLSVVGTSGTDRLTVDLRDGLAIQVGPFDYRHDAASIQRLEIDLASGGDSIDLVGSQLAENVQLRPEMSTIENQRLAIALHGIETIDFRGGGGPDRVYLYGSNGDDTLTAYPRQIELVGSGYRFDVSEIERTYVHADQGGLDIAYLYDSAGNDRLSVRPQFSSLAGDNYFNLASGFEKVYAYSNAGGVDSATLYDSIGNDTYSTSGDVASIVGSGFFSYTRFFEKVEAVSSAGGQDVASIYANDRQSLFVGSDLTGFQDASWTRWARGFASSKTYVDNRWIDPRVAGETGGDSGLSLASQTEASSLALAGDGNARGPIMVGPNWNFPSAFVSEGVEVMSTLTLHVEGSIERTRLDDLLMDEWREDQPPLPADAMVRLGQPWHRHHFDVELDWVDPLHERSLLDDIFAEHGCEGNQRDVAMRG